VLRLLLRGGEHPLGLLARLGADPVGFLLGVLSLLVELVVCAAALGLGLVVGEFQDLADPLADLLVGGLAAQALARGGQFQADPFGLVERLREPLLQVAGLAAGTRDELIHLPAAVPAHLDFEGAFTVQVGHQVCVISHGGTQEEYGRSAPVARPGEAELAVRSRPPEAAWAYRPGCRAGLRSRMWRQRARLSSLTTPGRNRNGRLSRFAAITVTSLASPAPAARGDAPAPPAPVAWAGGADGGDVTLEVRRRLVGTYHLGTLDGMTPSVHPDAWIAPGVVLVGRVTVGRAANVWYGSVLRADLDEIRVGPECNIQDQCCLHVDPGEPVILDERVSLGHRATVHGVIVEAGALIGIGAVVLGGARIGAGSLVAAGAVVRPGQQVPPGVLVAGVPGRVARELTDADGATFADPAAGYVRRAARHAGVDWARPGGSP